MRSLAVFFWIVLAPAALAQSASLPQFSSPYVNDHAEVLSPEFEAELAQTLRSLRDKNGVEMSVLTIKSRDAYGLHGSFETFARDTFNSWGIGNAQKNNGILVLVAQEDRAARIELGSGYAQQNDRIAEEILDEAMLPEFKDGRFEAGLRDGTTQIAARIVRGTQETGGSTSFRDGIIVGGMVAVFGLFVVTQRRRRAKTRRCPHCESNDIRRNRGDDGNKNWICHACGATFAMPLFGPHHRHDNDGDDGSSGGSGGGFGGGGSSGGGASGNW